MPNKTTVILVLFILIRSTLLSQPELKYADLGKFPLDNGQVIENCQIGYRTCGKLNSDRSNAVLFPTWFTGTTRSLLKYIGDGKIVDTTRYFVILADAFGNGVSSSPSNSPNQPDSLFPYFSIHDLVRSQYVLLIDVLKINRLYAVVGISMGGMQAFEWAVSYPRFIKKVVPIVGSPRLAPYDLMLWKTDYQLIEQCMRARCEDTGLLFSMIGNLSDTPEYFNRQTSREGVDSLIAQLRTEVTSPFYGHDILRQLRAMITHDISIRFNDSIKEAAHSVLADVFVIVATQDRVVTPGPAQQFAQLLGCKILQLESDCGHGVFSCELTQISEAIAPFLLNGQAK